jgi:hypothetical protein
MATRLWAPWCDLFSNQRLQVALQPAARVSLARCVSGPCRTQETPITSAPIVASFLSSLPAYRTGVAPVLRGVEIGLAHGFLLVGPFIKVGCRSSQRKADSTGLRSDRRVVLREFLRCSTPKMISSCLSLAI